MHRGGETEGLSPLPKAVCIMNVFHVFGGHLKVKAWWAVVKGKVKRVITDGCTPTWRTSFVFMTVPAREGRKWEEGKWTRRDEPRDVG